MNKSLLLGMFLVALSSSAIAATVKVEYPLELLALNGKVIESGENELNEGKHQLALRYSKQFKKSGSISLFQSKPIVLTIEVGEQNISISSKKYDRQRDAEKAFNTETPKLNVEGALNYSSEQMDSRGGVLPFSDIEKAISEHNKINGIELTSTGANKLSEVAYSVTENGNVEVSGDAVTQLKLWYVKASNEERKEFRRWMIDQE